MRKVTLVVNYSLPLKFDTSDNITKKREVDYETYLHRVGRTGRFGDRGICINLIDSSKDLQLIKNIQNYYKNSIKEIKLEVLTDINKLL